MKTLRSAGIVCALASLYAVVARLGLMMDAVAGFATLVWPPTGIALAAVLALGFRVWPAIAIGAFTVNVWIGASIPVALGIAAGNTLEAVVGAYALRRFAKIDLRLDRLRDVLSLVVLAGLGSTLISATIGTACLRAGGVIDAARVPDTWRAWWVGDVIGDLIIAPVLLTWAPVRRTLSDLVSEHTSRAAEAVLLGLLTAALSFEVFGLYGVGHPSMFYLFPVLTWAALRFGPRGASAATLLVSAVAIWGTTTGNGPFVRETLSTGLFPLQLFMAVLAVTALVLGATISERNGAIRAREESELRASFLSQASRLLQESLTYETTLQGLAQLAVPALGDLCTLLLVDEYGGLRRVATAHADPSKQRLAEEHARRLSLLLAETTDVAHPPQRAMLIPELNAESSRGNARAAEELRLRGEMGLASGITAPLVAREKLLGVLCLFRDRGRSGFEPEELSLAEELAARAALAVDNAQLYREAQGAVLSREEILAVVSHDLNNILSAMMGSTQLMLRAAEEQGRQADKKGLQIVQRSAQRMAHLIGDLLDAASLDAGVLALEKAPHDANSLIAEALDMEGPQAEQKGLHLEGTPLKAPVDIVCDRTRVVQVLGNLVSNALKFTEEGTIGIGVERNNGELVFEVRDTGAGIPRDQLDHVFERYWSGKPTEGSGHGLGLHIARGIVEAHGGKIWVHSREGQGSSFFFSLPLIS